MLLPDSVGSELISLEIPINRIVRPTTYDDACKNQPFCYPSETRLVVRPLFPYVKIEINPREAAITNPPAIRSPIKTDKKAL